MKIIPLHEAAANLQKYGKMSQRDPILVTVKGLPLFKLVGYKEGEDPMDFRVVDTGPKKSAKMATRGVLDGLKARERIDQRMAEKKRPKLGGR
jgi:prevent-host-death family protein